VADPLGTGTESESEAWISGSFSDWIEGDAEGDPAGEGLMEVSALLLD